ncbi:MAG: large conductance mechanosensitive channel protein MscL [Candidatus Eisenbacteria bacterium]|uniref:Large-conductance mechanosensitive channel n=1 Tax=Eiseniibacteriota bacterium TaxID=2212470 RepID=A0A7Y2ECV8_UNCEI|nr:large conductance mechanosensitive channel protein MscL [Candidatus Eisenbacteria bacterium]
MASLTADFKKFVLRGNLVDMAIGFTVGAAFTTVAKSLVNDVIMPVVGLAIGRVDFEDLFWVLDAGTGTPPYTTVEQAQKAGAVTLNYGVFINNLIALLLVALVMFLVIRSMNRIQDEFEDDEGTNDDAPKEPDNKKCKFCRSTIHFRAVRCPHCTSELPAKPSAN